MASGLDLVGGIICVKTQNNRIEDDPTWRWTHSETHHLSITKGTV